MNQLPHTTLNSLTFTRPGVEFVGQAFSLPSPLSGLFSYLRVPGKLLKLGRDSFRGAEPQHNRPRMPVLLNWSQNANFMRYLLGVDVGGSSDRETAGVSKRRKISDQHVGRHGRRNIACFGES